MESKKNNLATPISIIIAGAIVAMAIIYAVSRGSLPSQPSVGSPDDGAPVENLDAVKSITKADHIRGDLDAPVKVITFEDTECPFCKRFHPTMQQLMKEYEGRVAWVYRHFPLDQIHSKARKEAVATECANELGGNEKFWAYLDRLFEVAPSNDGLDLAELPKIAEYVGLNRAKFEKCLESEKYAQHIQEDLDDATASGGQGTPWSIVIAANGKKFPLSGAQPYSNVKALIDIALKEK